MAEPRAIIAAAYPQDVALLASLSAAFVVGLFSTVHCVGMCGGIVGALSFSLPPQIRGRRLWLGSYLLAYNLGRIASYAVVGTALGAGLGAALAGGVGHRVLQAAAALLLTGIGLYVAGWFPRFALIERIGVPLWRRIEPLGRRLLPVRSPATAFLYGMVWGSLPCGLVYSMLLWSLASAEGAATGLLMLAFGAGTLPATLGTGMLTLKIGRLTRQGWVRKLAGATLLALALGGLLASEYLHHSLPTPQHGQPAPIGHEHL